MLFEEANALSERLKTFSVEVTEAVTGALRSSTETIDSLLNDTRELNTKCKHLTEERDAANRELILAIEARESAIEKLSQMRADNAELGEKLVIVNNKLLQAETSFTEIQKREKETQEACREKVEEKEIQILELKEAALKKSNNIKASITTSKAIKF